VQALVSAGVVRGFSATVRERAEPWQLALTAWVNPPDSREAGSLISASRYGCTASTAGCRGAAGRSWRSWRRPTGPL